MPSLTDLVVMPRFMCSNRSDRLMRLLSPLAPSSEEPSPMMVQRTS